MKYMIIGTGGTGGILAFHLAKAGKNVTVIARGEHLNRIQEHGLTVHRLWNHSSDRVPVKAVSIAEAVEERPDVILVCVKSYSLNEIVPFMQKISSPTTVIIPVLNIFGTGAKLQEALPKPFITDGCIYVSAYIEAPGIIAQHSEILRLVYGGRESNPDILRTIQNDLSECGITAILSEHIRKACMKKFIYISPVGTASLYCNATAGDFRKDGEARRMLIALMKEIQQLAKAMDIQIEDNVIDHNLSILQKLPPDATTSMQRDVLAGRQSEMDGLVFHVLEMGEQFGISLPYYKMAAEKFREQLS